MKALFYALCVICLAAVIVPMPDEIVQYIASLVFDWLIGRLSICRIILG